MNEQEKQKILNKLSRLIEKAHHVLEGGAFALVVTDAENILLLVRQFNLLKASEKLPQAFSHLLDNYFEKLLEELVKLNHLANIDEFRLKILSLLKQVSELNCLEQKLLQHYQSKLTLLNEAPILTKLCNTPFKEKINVEADNVSNFIAYCKHGARLEGLQNTKMLDGQLENTLLILLPYFYDRLVTDTYSSFNAFLRVIQPMENLLDSVYAKDNVDEVLKRECLRYSHAVSIVSDKLLGKAFKSKKELIERLELIKSCQNKRIKAQVLACVLLQFSKQSNQFGPLSEAAWEIWLDGLLDNPVVQNKESALLLDYSHDLNLTRSVFSNNEIGLFEQQAQAIENSQTLLNKFLDNAIDALGEPPCDIGLLFLGSSSRGDRMPHSDVELALLYEPKAIVENNNNNTNPIVRIDDTLKSQFKCDYYISHLICLLELQIIFLGESHPEKQGFWLDDSTSIRKLHHLRGSPKWVIQSGIVDKEKPLDEYIANQTRKLHSFLYDPSALSLFKPKLINAEKYNGKCLFDDYMTLVNDYLSEKINPQLLSELIQLPVPRLELPDGLNNSQSLSESEKENSLNVSPPNPLKLLQNKGPNRHWHPVWIVWDVMCHAVDGFDTENNTVDLKKAYYKPLAYLGLALKLYFELETDNLEQAFSSAVQKKLLSPELGQWCIQIFEWISVLRVKLHLKANKQVETLNLESLTDIEQARLTRLSSHIKLFENALRQYLQDCLHHPGKPFGLDEMLLRYFIESLIACQQKEEYIEWFNALTGFLLDTKQPLVVHRHYYRQLPNEYRHICLKAARKAFKEKDSLWCQDNHFWGRVFDGPNAQGERLSYSGLKFSWEQRLKLMLTQEENKNNAIPNILIEGLLAGKGYLHPDEAQKLMLEKWIDKSGKFTLKEKHPIAKNLPGNHLVIPYPDKDNPQFYLKIFPEYPLVELFLHDLGRRLGAYTPRFVDVWRWQCGKYDYPILVTEAVPGQSLQEALEVNKELDLNLQAFNESVVLSALTQLEDNKPDNLIVKTSDQGAQIVLIDADRWFVPAFKDNKLHAKDITFCLEDMYKKIDWGWREEFLSLNPQSLLSAWVEFMTAQAAQCIDIFGNKINDYCNRRLNKRQERKSVILPPLKTNVVTQLHSDIQSLQSEVSQRPNVNFFKLVSSIQARIANHYGLSHEQKLGTPLKRFDYVAGHAYTRGKGGKEYYTSNIDFKTQQQDMWQGLSASKDMIENWERDIGLIEKEIASLSEKPAQIKQAIEGLTQNNIQPFKNLTQRGKEKALHQFNEWHRLSDEAYQALMTALKLTSNWQHLTFKDNERLRESDLAKILNNSPNLITLILDNCPKIDGKALEGYCVGDCSLRSLSINALPELIQLGRLEVGRFRPEQKLSLPNLEKLSIMNCQELGSININAPLLSYLRVHQVDKLSVCGIYSKAIESINFKKCTILPFKEIPSLIAENSIISPMRFTADSLENIGPEVLELLKTFPFLLNLDQNIYQEGIYPKYINLLERLLKTKPDFVNGFELHERKILLEMFIALFGKIKIIVEKNERLILPDLLEDVFKGDEFKSRDACEALGGLGSATESVVNQLLLACNYKADISKFAIWALAKLDSRDERVIEVLLENINHRTRFVSHAAFKALKRQGEAKLTIEILKMIRYEDRSLHCEGISYLSKQPNKGKYKKELINSLIDLIHTERTIDDEAYSVNVCTAAIHALIPIYNGHDHDKLIDALLWAIKKYRRIGSGKTLLPHASLKGLLAKCEISHLLTACKNKEMRSAAYLALGYLGCTETQVVDYLFEAVMKEIRKDGWEVLSASFSLVWLVKQDVKLIKYLLAFIKDRGSRYWALWAMLKTKFDIPAKALIDELIRLIKDKEERFEVRIEACHCLGRINSPGNKETLDILLALLDEATIEKWMKHRSVYKALGELGEGSGKIAKVILSGADFALKNIERWVDQYGIYKAVSKSLGLLGSTEDKCINFLLDSIQTREFVQFGGPKLATKAFIEIYKKNSVDKIFYALTDGLFSYIKRIPPPGIWDNRKFSFPCRDIEKLYSILMKIQINEKMIMQLLKLGATNFVEIRHVVYQGLQDLSKQSEEVIKTLLKAMSDQDKLIRRAACGALGGVEQSDDKTIDKLLLAVKDEDKNVRYSAIAAIGEIGSMREGLLEILKDISQNREEKSGVRDIAYWSSANLGGATVKKLLKDFSNELDALIKNSKNKKTDMAILKSNFSLFPPAAFLKNSNQALLGWTIKDVAGDGNCFYHVLAAQLKLIKHERLSEIPEGTELHDVLRLDIQQQAFSDAEWTGDEDFEAVVRQYNVVLAIVDTRNSAAGFRCHFVDDDGNYGIDTDGEFELPDRPVIKMAYTGSHYMSVASHPVLHSGAYRVSSNEASKPSSVVLN